MTEGCRGAGHTHIVLGQDEAHLIVLAGKSHGRTQDHLCLNSGGIVAVGYKRAGNSEVEQSDCFMHIFHLMRNGQGIVEVYRLAVVGYGKDSDLTGAVDSHGGSKRETRHIYIYSSQVR